MLRSVSRAALSGLCYSADLILPPACVSCSSLVTYHNLLCPRCWSRVQLITPPICDRLGIPLPGYEGSGPHISPQAIVKQPIFCRARAAGHYSGVLRRLILRFKFEDRHEPIPLFVRLMQEAGRSLLGEADFLIPVPLHRLRLLQRRFNQSAVLATRLGHATGVDAQVTALKRIRRTTPQVGLTQENREANVANAFSVARVKRKFLRGKRVILIDDVITTGATANACAAALLDAGAAAVDVLAVAIVSSPEFDVAGEGR